MRFELKPYQVTTVEYGIKNNYSIFALDMGLGKSLCALETSFKKGGKTVIVCPPYLIDNWHNEIKKFYPEKIVSKFRKGKEFYKVWDTDIVITGYTMLEYCDSLFEWCNTVIADEANYVKSMKAKRTSLFHKLVYENSVKNLYLLTGTPIKNRVEEYYSLIALTYYDPRITKSDFLDKFPDSITFADHFSYREEYIINRNTWNERPVVKWSGSRNTEELKKYLSGRYIRFKSEDVLDLEKPIYKNILASEMNDEKLKESFLKFSDNESVLPDRKAKAALDKVPFTIKYLEDLLEEIDCVVVFSDHVESAKAIASHFKVSAITGEMSGPRRMEIADRFQDGTIKILVATIGSFSTGVTLTRANNMVFNDYCWVPGDLAQAEGRILRVTQKRQCVIHRVLGSPQDEYILDVIQNKMDTIRSVV